MKKIFINIIFVLSCQIIYAQKVENVRVSYNDDHVFIGYDLIGIKPNDRFNVIPTFFDKDGNEIVMLQSSGDIGNDIQAGTKKIIKWNPRNSDILLDDSYYAIITAHPQVNIKTAEHLILSTIYPGAGDYRLSNGKAYFLYGIAAYGSLASAIILNNSAYSARNNYIKTLDIEKRNKYYKQTQNCEIGSYIAAGVAVAVWAYDIIHVAIKVSKLKKNTTPQSSKYYYAKSQKFYYENSELTYINNKTPYELSIEKADGLLAQNSYQEAKDEFQKALTLNSSESYPIKKIAEIDKKLAEIKALNDKYNATIATADSLFKSKKYDESKSKYNAAILIKQDEKYPKNKIAEIDNILKQLAIDKEYNDNITGGDISFKEKDYETAKIYYNTAIKLKPNETYPVQKIQEINQIQAKIAQQKIDKEYNDFIKKGDVDYYNGDYSDALAYYNEAANIKTPDNSLSEKLKKAGNKVYELNQAYQEKQRKLEQQENDKKYKQSITNGDAAYYNKEYDKAKSYYQAASNIKPSESYPKNKIAEINKLLEIAEAKAEANTAYDLPTLFEKCKPSVFFVITSDYVDQYQGSGFFITSTGVGISNYHVFKDTYESAAKIYTEDGNSYDIEKIYEKNEDLDYIIFKVKKPYDKSFPKLKIASNTPKVGESVFAIGNPEGLEKTLSTGIVSGIRGDNKEYIQTTTPITHGSSGGPMFNLKGEVVGITTFSYGQDGGNLFFCMNIQKIPYSKYLYY